MEKKGGNEYRTIWREGRMGYRREKREKRFCVGKMRKDCPEMKIFWYDGMLYTPSLGDLFVENNYLPNVEDDVNEVILRHCKRSNE